MMALKNKKGCKPKLATFSFGGERGIQTPGTCNSSAVFKTVAIDHSAISPKAVQRYASFCYLQILDEKN